MQLVRKALVILAALALLSVALPALAMDKFEAELKVEEARISFLKFMQSPDANTAKWLLKRCQAVALFPGMVKAGFVVGGKYGTGVILKRQADGSWSAPAFFIIGGASIGFQIGAESMDLFMVIMTNKGLQAVLKNQAKFGVDASVAAGPVGRNAEAAIAGLSTKSDLYSYSRAKGAFAGATLSGAGIEFDKDTAKAYYGKAVTAQSIFAGKVKAPANAQKLMQELTKYGK
ncbi:MAG: lipid-binding SYLF domain-containing protein [Thermodesulfobacteriota bacterium]